MGNVSVYDRKHDTKGMSEVYCVTFILYLSSTDRLIVARLAVHGRGDEYKIGIHG